MKKILFTVAAATILTTSSLVADVKIGAGVALAGNSGTVRVPIDLDGSFRIEPEISIGYSSFEDNSATNVGIGAGMYLLSSPSSTINIYYGGKVGLDISDNDFDDSTNFVLTPAAGFEYYIDKSVSIGGEVGFAFSFGDRTSIGTVTSTTLRYYF